MKVSDFVLSWLMWAVGMVAYFRCYRNPNHSPRAKFAIFTACLFSGPMAFGVAILCSGEIKEAPLQLPYHPEPGKEETIPPPESDVVTTPPPPRKTNLGKDELALEEWEFCLYKLALSRPVMVQFIERADLVRFEGQTVIVSLSRGSGVGFKDFQHIMEWKGKLDFLLYTHHSTASTVSFEFKTGN